MAQVPLSEQKYQDVQVNLLSEASQGLRMQCVICTKAKKKLYFCNFNGCPQANRMICKSCGRNTHSEDDDSDDDEDETKGQQPQACEYHVFDVNKPYIREICASMPLSTEDRLKIQVNWYIICTRNV